MHVLILPSEEFLPAHSHTTGIFQYHQAKALQDAGHKVGVVSISLSFSYQMIAKALAFRLVGKKVGNACDAYSPAGLLALAKQKTTEVQRFLQRQTVQGIEVLRIDGFFYWPPVENHMHFGWVKAGLAAYEEYVRLNGTPNVVHAHNAVYAGMLASQIRQRHGVPYVLTEHSTAFARNTITDKNILRRIKAAYDSASVLTAVSQPFCDLLNRRFSFNRFEVLHNVLDPDFTERPLVQTKRGSNGFLFVNIAELHPKKDHATLIRGFKKLLASHPDACLEIGGEGLLADELKALVTAEGLDGAVRFLGLLNREEVFAALRKADCFVLTSKFETFGVVVIESMLAGRPVIATACGGPESFVTPKTGIIIETENSEQLAAAMEAMIANAEQYEPEAIRQFALDHFGAAAFVRNATAYYARATGKAKQPAEKASATAPAAVAQQP